MQVSLSKTDTAQEQDFPKGSPVPVRNVPPSKIAFPSRRGSENKNTHATKLASPQRQILSSNSGEKHFCLLSFLYRMYDNIVFQLI